MTLTIVQKLDKTIKQINKSILKTIQLLKYLNKRQINYSSYENEKTQSKTGEVAKISEQPATKT